MPPEHVAHLLEHAADRDPAKVAVVAGGERLTYREIDDRANELARALREAGIEQGDRVVMPLENSVDAVVSVFGALKARAVFVPVSPRISAQRLEEVVRDSRAALVMEKGSGIPFQSAQGKGIPEPCPDLAALIYTSGSTGEPKGVMLTHRNITFQAASVCAYLENSADDVILNVLPMAFAYGLSQLMTAFHAGATLVLERSFSYPAAILDTMARERVTGFPLVPTMATVLLQQDLQKRRLPDLRYITNAAAALPVSRIQRLRDAFPGVRLYSMYGLTECRVCYLPPDQLDARPASVGIPIPGTDAFVVDAQGRRAPHGTLGELVVSGPHVMKGYWHKPEATSAVLKPGPDGKEVFYTGDLFRADAKSYLHFVDRKDDVIKTRGEKVAPRQVEEIIAQLPGVAEVAVYGVPDELTGEAVVAMVSLAPHAELSVNCIKRHCLAHLEPFMVPSSVEIRQSLPVTVSGKVSRRALKAMAATP
jgi:long-chain acyl-CoA synthetase